MATKTINWNKGGGSFTVTYGGSGNGTIVVTSDANPLHEGRSQNLTVKTTKGGTVPKTITVAQAMKPYIDLTNAVVTAANQTYSGSALTPTPTVKLNGVTIPSTGYDVTYNNNTNAGTATITITGKGDYTGTANGSFTINKATPTYTSPVASTNLTYSGSSQYLTTTGSTNHGTIYYSSDGINWYITRRTGTNAGSYTTYWKLTGDANHNDVASTAITTSIAKAAPTYTAPTKKTGLTYTGSSQALLNAGSTSHGTIYYSLDNSTWSTSVPTQTNANTTGYTVYWKLTGDSNHSDIASTVISGIIIAKVASSLASAPTAKSSLTYNTSTQSLVNAGSASGGTVYYQATTTNSKPSSTSGFSSSIPTGTNAGTYYVWYYVKGDSNHNDTAISSTAVSVSIARANRTLSFGSPTTVVKTSSSVINTATPSAGSGDGTITYSISSTTYATIGSSTGKVTAKTSEGSATVTATISQGTNYNSATASYTINVIEYITNGLVFMLDGKMKGGDSNNWTDLVGGKKFPYQNCIVNTDRITFNGSGIMEIASTVSYPSSSYSIEIVVNNNNYNSTCAACFGPNNVAAFLSNYFSHAASGYDTLRYTTDHIFSANDDIQMINGREVPAHSVNTWSTTSGYISLGGRHNGSSLFTGDIYSIRVYNRKLSKSEMTQNQNVDNTRFSFGIHMEESYISDGLVFQLDGINKGSDTSNWTDQIGGLKFPYGSVATKGTNYVQFTGAGSIKATSSTVFSQTSCTLEATFEKEKNISVVVFPARVGDIMMAFSTTDAGTLSYGSSSAPRYTVPTSEIPRFISVNADRCIVSGRNCPTVSNDSWGAQIDGTLKIGGRNTDRFYTGKMYAIRIYSRKLSFAEMMQNQRLDYMRFGVGYFLEYT